MAFGYLVVALLAAAVATFALQNPEPISVHFLFWSTQALPAAGVTLARPGRGPDRGRGAAGHRPAALAVAMPGPRDARRHAGERAGRAGARPGEPAGAAASPTGPPSPQPPSPPGADPVSTRERRTLIQAGWVIAFDGRGHRLCGTGWW